MDKTIEDNRYYRQKNRRGKGGKAAVAAVGVLSALVLLFGPTFLAYFFPENVRSEIEVNLGGVAGLVDGGSSGLRDFSDVINAAASDAADKWSIGNSGNQTNTDGQDQAASGDGDANSQLPAFPDHGDADYIIVNDNIPYFTENEILYTKGSLFRNWMHLDAAARPWRLSAWIPCRRKKEA